MVFDNAGLSPSAAYGGALLGALALRSSSRAQKRDAYRRRRLSGLGHVAFEHAAEGARSREIVETLCSQKAQRLSHLGSANPYALDETRQFLRALTAQGLLETHAMTLDSGIVATYVGLAHQGHFSVLANSFGPEKAVARCTPGDVLLHALLQNLAGRGFESFDLGIGEAQYKDAVCNETFELYDSVLAVTPAGSLAAPLIRATLVCKRSIKRSPWLSRSLERLRRIRPLQPATA